MDSKADFSKYEEFILGEDRYRSLKNLNKNAKELLDKNKKNAMKRYQYYEKLSKNEE